MPACTKTHEVIKPSLQAESKETIIAIAATTDFPELTTGKARGAGTSEQRLCKERRDEVEPLGFRELGFLFSCRLGLNLEW
jgi:hypothetical protein